MEMSEKSPYRITYSQEVICESAIGENSAIWIDVAEGMERVQRDGQ